jgi:hypothetical protein
MHKLSRLGFVLFCMRVLIFFQLIFLFVNPCAKLRGYMLSFLFF